jgi:class 3 adenylate cyclase
MHYSRCGSENPAGKKFCAECGAQLAAQCPRCGAESPSSNKFCGDCGAALSFSKKFQAPSADAAARSAAVKIETHDGERKFVTALFADLKGSTELLQGIDPEEGRAIVEPMLRIMAEAVRRYDGYVVRTTGDGLFALFGAPIADEDHPQRALYAALAMQNDLRAHRQGRLAQGLLAPETRVGVHSGEVVAYRGEASGNTEYRLIGHTANLASRLEALAPPGSIAISAETSRLCEGYFELRPLAPVMVKGVTEPVEVYEVLGPGVLRSHFDLSARRGLTKFVGRERELEQIRRALEQASAGEGRIVALVADPGTGKSRLVHEFKATLPDGCKPLEANAVAHGKGSAWLLTLELLHRFFSIESVDSAQVRREKVGAALTSLDPALSDTRPYLGALLNIVEGADPLAQMDPRIKLQRTLEALKRIFLHESVRQPLVLIFEDLHWIDEQSQALLDLLADSLAGARILIVVNYRPEYRHEWGNKSCYAQIRLEPLAGADGAAMLTALLGEAVELDPLKRMVLERAGGNPFFLEEIVNALFEEGVLTRNGAVKLARSLGQLRLPATVQGMLAARIDRLPSEQKELLQTLAVIGRQAPLNLLRHVAVGTDAQLDEASRALRASEFIYEHPAPGDVEYVFKHALTQEVAYNTLLIERRNQLHERVGAAIEVLYSKSLDDHLAELAHHYGRGRQSSKATQCLNLASRRAAASSAFAEALALAQTGLSLIGELPPDRARDHREFELLRTMVGAATATEGWDSPRTISGYNRMLELAGSSNNEAELRAALTGGWARDLASGRYQRSLEMSHQMLTLAQRVKNPNSLADALTAKGWTSLWMDPIVETLCFASTAQWVAGYPDRARRSSESSIKRARRLDQPLSLALSLFSAGFTLVWVGELKDALSATEEGEAIAERDGYPHMRAGNRYVRGWATGQQGHPNAVHLITDGIANWTLPMCKFQHLILAEVGLYAGKPQQTLAAVNRWREFARINGEHHGEPEAERFEGQALLKIDISNAPLAEKHFRAAIDIATVQGAKSWELRAATSLARLLRDTGRRDEARATLAQIYNWFSEGFDTRDLKNAKALLDELGE